MSADVSAVVPRYKWRASLPDGSVHVAVERPHIGWVTLCGVHRRYTNGFVITGRDFSSAVTCATCADAADSQEAPQ